MAKELNKMSSNTIYKWRLGLLATSLAMGLALVVFGIDSYKAAIHGSHAVTEAEVFSMMTGARREIMRARGDREEILSGIYRELSDRGLHYLAIMGQDSDVLISIGKATIPLFPPWKALEHPAPKPIIEHKDGVVHVYAPVFRGRRDKTAGQQTPLMLAAELKPKEAAKIVASARFTLFLEITAAAILLLATVVFWRMARRSEILSKQMEQERLETAAQLEHDRQLKVLGQMSAVLGHEIKNPLASLKGHAQLLAEKLAEGDPAEAQVKRIVDEAVQLETLTQQVLDFAKTGEISLSNVYPDDLAHAAVAFTEADPVEVIVHGELRSWSLDRSRMEQVLVNLLRNARQASGDGAPIEIHIEVGETLEIRVRDRGEGIGPGQAEKIFEPFFTGRAKGTGLGLAFARMVVKGHGGEITASNHDDGGAVFTLKIPASRAGFEES